MEFIKKYLVKEPQPAKKASVSPGECCPDSDCYGSLTEHDDGESCSCHIDPPCSHCITKGSYVECDTCGQIFEWTE